MFLKPNRRPEWWLASFTVAWGLFVAFVPSSVDGAPFFVVRLWASHTIWGATLAMVGILHLWALTINGRRQWSPYVRLGATVASALGFGLFLAGMLAAIWFGITPPTLLLVAQFGFVHASCCAFWVAGCDSYSAFTCPPPEVPDAP